MSSSTGNGIEPIEGYERVPEMAAEMPATRLVYVADREADLLAMMARAQVLGTPTDWLVRAKHNRCLPDGDGEKLWAHTSAGAALGEITFTMPGRDDQKARKVRQQLWAREVSIANGKAGTVLATCIVAGEIDAPKGVKPVEWRLLTNRAASTLEDAIELIDWYRARWEIEIYFNVLKNGCKVEALQLSAIDRIERALALFMIVAWRVAYLMRIGRTCPDLDAALLNSGRVSALEKASASRAAASQRGIAIDRPARPLPWPQERRGARRQDDLAGIATCDGRGHRITVDAC